MNVSEKTAEEKLAEEVRNDFLRRQEIRRPLERKWQLNMKFVNGNQYCGLDASGELRDEESDYYWQEKRVFNHIAPLVDTRLSKLSRIRPVLTVRAASDDERDRHSAALAAAILAAAQDDGELDGVTSAVTTWSEICGTGFYKIIWNSAGGRAVGISENGERIFDGAAEAVAVSPFEIYPYSLTCESLSEQPSIIHAKALPVQDIYAAYGVKLAGRSKEEIQFQRLDGAETADGGEFSGYELVIERYERPCIDMPEGRFTAVAGGRVLYDGILPYVNGDGGVRGYPFVKQVSVPSAGNFFGSSVVERLIPLQRAFNAVKNRKHEFMNRIAIGAVAVEDGSVDAEELAEDGLAPGKVIVYRQGSNPPEMLSMGNVPDEFWKEEENLLTEFVKVSGTGDWTENADGFAGITSATGLQLVLEQDDARLNMAYSGVKRAVKEVGKHILRLYRQFATDVRLLKYAGNNNALNLFYFKGSDISSDDVVLDADSDLNMTPAQKRTVIYEMLDKGLFCDENGKLSVSAKNKVLELLGYSSFAGGRDLGELNRARAGKENLKLKTSSAEVKDYDDHAVHVTEHTAYLLSEELTKEAEKRICAHIEIHRKKLMDMKKEEQNG